MYTMNYPLTAISFQPPSFNLQPSPEQRLPSRQQEIRGKWATRTKRPDLLLKPTLGPNNATGGLNNSNDRRGNTLPSSPLSDVIQEFYSSLNDKDSKRLEKLIAPDCIMDDTAYYKPLDVKNTHIYFRRLMEAMGKNVKFAIDEVSHGVEPTTHTYFGRLMEVMGKNVKFGINEVSREEPTIAVMWHLEWNGETIPFTKGCSFYICSGNGAALRIRKVHIFDESPLKPGKLALETFHIVTNLFDTFPNIAEGFLKNPEALVQSFERLYKFREEPFIVPFLVALTMVLSILCNIFKRVKN